jgi:hypothetical protein
MIDQDRRGTDWHSVELDAIIADYFAMLGDELAHRPYVKAQRRAALMEMTGRTAPSIEFKHRNISAVLQEMGLPWIWGYKPAPNYQDALSDAVARYLDMHREVLETAPVAQHLVTNVGDVFTPAPVVVPRATPPSLERLIRKFDPVERDFRNRRLGKAVRSSWSTWNGKDWRTRIATTWPARSGGWPQRMARAPASTCCRSMPAARNA